VALASDMSNNLSKPVADKVAMPNQLLALPAGSAQQAPQSGAKGPSLLPKSAVWAHKQAATTDTGVAAPVQQQQTGSASSTEGANNTPNASTVSIGAGLNITPKAVVVLTGTNHTMGSVNNSADQARI
jgi:hypothetical protein